MSEDAGTRKEKVMTRAVNLKVWMVLLAAAVIVGLSVILALLFGAASAALEANGSTFFLGKAKNTATRMPGIIGKVATNSALVVKNPSGGSALGLSVGDPAANPDTKSVPDSPECGSRAGRAPAILFTWKVLQRSVRRPSLPRPGLARHRLSPQPRLRSIRI